MMRIRFPHRRIRRPSRLWTQCCVPVLTLTLALPGLAIGAPSSSSEPRLAPRVPSAKSLVTALGPHRDAKILVLKLRDDLGARLVDGRLRGPSAVSKSAWNLAAVERALSTAQKVGIEPVFSQPVELLDALRRRGELLSGRRLADLSQFFVVQLASEEQAEPLLRHLHALAEVENAYAQPRHRLSVVIGQSGPNLVGRQGYRDPAPEGIGAAAALSRGLRGEGIAIADIEANWNLNHRDLFHLKSQRPIVALVAQSDWLDPGPGATSENHGTATLGVLAAQQDPQGIDGLAPNAQIHVAPQLRQSDPTWFAADAVLLATLRLEPGDVLLLELERPADLDPAQNYPYEFDDLEFAVVQQTTALGIHVIEPAGNSPGGVNFDFDTNVFDPFAGRSKFDLTFRDSGAVMVGGGASATNTSMVGKTVHQRYVNSNYGTRVNTYAWAQNVTTTGYGPDSSSLANCDDPSDPAPGLGKNNYYTFCFNGTSSAGAIVAGAASLLEQHHQQKYGQPSSPRAMRNLLSLGTPAPSPAQIGFQPDLEFQLDLLDNGVIPHLFQAEVGTGPPANFGSAIAGGRDIDGDGIADFVVGAPNYRIPLSGGGFATDAGRVYVFSGATGGFITSFDGAGGDLLGSALALANLNGDQYADILMGAPGADDDQGRVRIVLYDPDPTNIVVMDRVGSNVDDRFGAAIVNLGDPHQHGLDSYAVGAPGALFTSAGGEVLTFFATDSNYDLLFAGPGPGSQFGAALAVGDYNDDGIVDLIIGAPGDTQGGSAGGAVSVGELNGSIYDTLYGPLSGTIFPAEFGASVAAGDLNGDGVAELVVGAPGRSEVLVYEESSGLIDRVAGSGFRVGQAVAVVGDFNGDGHVDIASGQPKVPIGSVSGRVAVHLGPWPQATHAELSFTTPDLSTNLGQVLAAVGDINGDGLPDLMAGEPRGDVEGRAYVYAAGPGPNLLIGKAKMTADPPVLEAVDTDGDGCSGGGLSPSQVTFYIDAGSEWAGANYIVTASPDPGCYLAGATGVLNAAGVTSAPQLGPVPESILCSIIGAEMTLSGVAIKDIDGDGSNDFFFTNEVTVRILSEFGGCSGTLGTSCPSEPVACP